MWILLFRTLSGYHAAGPRELASETVPGFVLVLVVLEFEEQETKSSLRSRAQQPLDAPEQLLVPTDFP